MQAIDAPLGLRPAGPVVRAETLGTWHEAADALRAAREAAAATILQARADADHERLRGYADGRRDGMAEAASIMAEVTARAGAYLRTLEESLPALTLEVVEHLLGSFDGGDLLPRCVSHAILRVRHGAGAVLRVPPHAADATRQAVAALDLGPVGIAVEPDPALPPGACVFSSSYGVVELGLDAQLRALRERLGASTLAGAA